MQIKDALTLNNKAVEGKDRGRVERREATVSKSGGQAASSEDRVVISERSREMAKAHETLAATPAVRSEKVAAIKERIDNQEYKVDADKVAGKMITDILADMT